MDKNKIIEEANIYISNELSIKETASLLGVSKRTLQIHLSRLEEIDKKLYKLVSEKKSKNIKEGRILGGKIGKATPRYSKELANKIANEIILSELTYEEAALEFGIPKSTIYEMVHSSYIDANTKNMLELVALSNNKKVLVSNLSSRR